MLGLSQGPKLSMKSGYGVSWFICWALVGHVGTMLGLSGLMLSIWRMFVAYLSQLCSQKKHVGPISGSKIKHEKGVRSFMVHLLGSCWPCRDHVGPSCAYVEHLEDVRGLSLPTL